MFIGTAKWTGLTGCASKPRLRRTKSILVQSPTGTAISRMPRRWRCAPMLPATSWAVHARQADIKQHHVRRQCFGECNRRGTVECGAHFVAVEPECERLGAIAIVVDDADTGRRGRLWRHVGVWCGGFTERW